MQERPSKGGLFFFLPDHKRVLIMLMKNLFPLVVLALVLSVGTFAQDQVIDVSEIPISADNPSLFAPPGWKVEKIARGDLNGDRTLDQAITLIEDRPFKPDDAPKPDRNRVLVVVFSDGKKFDRVAVADKLLQCTSCGGSFYGVMDAPVSVTIVRGVLVVRQDHGSREVSESTFRFRHDKATGRMVLIGYDYNYYDRATGETAKESTNYVTGSRVTSTGKGKRQSTKRTTVKVEPVYLDSIVGDDIEYAAAERLGLG
jgi:hypothetical protein